MAAVPSIGRASLVEASAGAAAPAAAAAGGLYERHAAKILSFCLHRLGSREEAEDAVQTTFMNAFRALRRGVVPESEAAWLYAIAENVCLSRRRSSGRRRRVESPADLELVEHVVPAPTRDADELIGLEDALAALPEQQRRAILLREWQGLSYREVAEELGVSQSAVETLIFRARRSLAQGLEQPASSRPRLRRLLHAFDLGPALGLLKALFAGGAAAKATATAVAVTAAVGVAGGSAPARAPVPAAVVEPAVVAPAGKSVVPAASVPRAVVPAAVADKLASPRQTVRTEEPKASGLANATAKASLKARATGLARARTVAPATGKPPWSAQPSAAGAPAAGPPGRTRSAAVREEHQPVRAAGAKASPTPRRPARRLPASAPRPQPAQPARVPASASRPAHPAHPAVRPVPKAAPVQPEPQQSPPQAQQQAQPPAAEDPGRSAAARDR